MQGNMDIAMAEKAEVSFGLLLGDNQPPQRPTCPIPGFPDPITHATIPHKPHNLCAFQDVFPVLKKKRIRRRMVNGVLVSKEAAVNNVYMENTIHGVGEDCQ